MVRGRGGAIVGETRITGGSGGGGRPRGRGRGRGHAGGGGGNSVGKFLAPHTGKQAGAIANSEAGTEYNAGIREGREQAKGSRKREGDLGQWYAQLASDYQGAQNQGAAALQSVENTTSAQLAAAGQRSSADQAQLASQDEQFASLVGGPKDTAGLAKIAQAAGAASAARVDQSKPVLSEQANFVARLGGDKTAARMQGIEARQAERLRRDKIVKDVAAQRKEKGQARVSNKEKIRESDRGYASEIAKLKLARREARSSEQAAAASAALAQVESARQASNDAISNRQAQERIGIESRSQRTTAKHYKTEAKAAAAAGGKGGLTPAEKLSRGEHSADAMTEAKNLLAIKVPKSPKEWAQFQAGLTEKMGSSYSAEAARAVAALRQEQAAKSRKGYASRAAAERATRAGHR
jgi:hypothetical protein